MFVLKNIIEMIMAYVSRLKAVQQIVCLLMETVFVMLDI